MSTSSRSLELNRRAWLRLAAAGLSVSAPGGWMRALADSSAKDPTRKRSCVLLWMNGGPSQTDTFDLKPGHANGGPFRPIETAAYGVRISEHLPKVAQVADRLALVRSMSTKEGDHGRATYFLRTGYAPQGQVQYPSLGSLVAKELGDEESELPGFVSISPYRFFSQAAYGPGFLGQEYAPLVVGENGPGRAAGAYNDATLRVKDMQPPDGVDRRRADARLALTDSLNSAFLEGRPSLPVQSHRTALERAVKLMRSDGVKAFRLDDEPEKLRDAYGRNAFGQGCLLARRLVERGVPFVEVTLGGLDGQPGIGWDTHAQNFEAVKSLSAVLDSGWGTLMKDLAGRGLLDSTTVVWMGEFGRTPRINNQAGRDHFPNAWTAVLGGGGIKGGQVIGRTSADGQTVEDRPVSVGDFIATVCLALGIDPKTQNVSNVGRPIRIADPDAKPIKEALMIAAACRVLLALAASAASAEPGRLPYDVFVLGPATTALTIPDDVFVQDPKADRVDVVLFGKRRVAVVRLHVTVSRRPYRSAWDDFVNRLHAYLDRDNDGVLTTAEANKAPWTNLLQSAFNGGRNPFQLTGKPVPLDADRDGKVAVDELAAYLRAMQNFDALASSIGTPPDERTEAVFALLDRDGDKSLSSSELAGGESLLSRLDADEDEVLDLSELTPDRSPLADQFGGVGAGTAVDVAQSPAVVLTGDDVRAQVAKRVHRDPHRLGKDSGPPTAFALSDADFRAADRVRDGSLSADELARYLADPTPDLELSVTLFTLDANGQPTQAQSGVTIVEGSAGKSAGGPTAKASGNDGVVLEFDGSETMLNANNALNVANFQFFEGQFTESDGDKNGVLDAKEARGNFFLQRMFTVADRDGDGKLTKAELKVYVERNVDAVASRTSVVVSDRGSMLHATLDADKDTRLTRRELRKTPAHLGPLDANRDGSIAATELPRRTLLTVGRENGQNVARAYGVANSSTTSMKGPAWFVGMDVNRDGDVSPREFLGTPAQFTRLDADRDGLIDATEAAKAH